MSTPNNLARAALLASTALVGAAFQPAEAHEAVIGLSPFGSRNVIEQQIQTITSHLAETLAPGESAWVVNAFTQEEIAEFRVPADAAPDGSFRERARANRPYFRGVKAFLDQVQPGEIVGGFDGQIDLPGFLRAVGTNYPAWAPRDLIILGSPVTDPIAAGFSMRDGGVPNDAHIAASRAVTPYGAAGQQDHLANYTVHWGTWGAPWKVSDQHAFHLERFLALTMKSRGAVLVTFSEDTETPVRNAHSVHRGPLGPYTLEQTDRLAMIRFQQRPAEAPEVSIYERPLSNRVPDREELRSATKVEIAIRWTCECDMDLAVTPRPGAETISFRNPATAEGRLFKDFTSAQSLNNGFEIIELDGPIDLTGVTAAINFYGGSAPGGATVEVRIAIGGETWSQQIALTVQHGNGGAGLQSTMRTGRAANPAWVIVSPFRIVAES